MLIILQGPRGGEVEYDQSIITVQIKRGWTEVQSDVIMCMT